jgi:hypothetical protein
MDSRFRGNNGKEEELGSGFRRNNGMREGWMTLLRC